MGLLAVNLVTLLVVHDKHLGLLQLCVHWAAARDPLSFTRRDDSFLHHIKQVWTLVDTEEMFVASEDLENSQSCLSVFTIL